MAVANPEVILNSISGDFIAIGGEIVLRIQFGVHFYGFGKVGILYLFRLCSVEIPLSEIKRLISESKKLKIIS